MHIAYYAGLACRVLQMGPLRSSFLGKVQIEVPFVASLKGGNREVAILKCDNATKGNWSVHHQDEQIVGDATPDENDDELFNHDKMLKVIAILPPFGNK